jgi:hypothetical protein
VEAALAGIGCGAPFVIHAAEPAQGLEKFVAKGRFQPRKIFTLRRPLPDPVQVTTAFRAERAPLGGAVTDLDAVADKIAGLGGQGEMRTGAECRRVTKRAVFLADHVRESFLYSVFSVRISSTVGTAQSKILVGVRLIIASSVGYGKNARRKIQKNENGH